jgi:hypothetical protein
VHAAEAAQQAMETELRKNLADLRTADANTVKRLKPLDDFADLLIKDFDDGMPTAQIKAQMAQHVKDGIDFGAYLPSFRHETWDVAVANHSASYIDPATLSRLSAAYAAQREVNTSALTLLVNIPGYVNALTDARVGASDPHEFLRAMRQVALTVGSAHGKYTEREEELERALPEEQHAETAAAKAPASAGPAASAGR